MPRVKLFDREEVLQKAIELFWKKGYYATSINDLVQHLGLSRSSLYDTFGDKHALFELAFEHYQEENSANLRKYLRSQESVKEGMAQLFKKAIEEALMDPDHKGCLMVNTTTEMVPGDEKIREKLILNRELLEGMFAEFVTRGQRSGELSPELDPQVVAALMFTLYSGLNVTAKITRDRDVLMRSVESALAIFER